MRAKKWILSSLLVVFLAVLAGCQSIGYYKQALSGQLEMLSHQQPLPALIHDPDTPSKLKEKFKLILELRIFAERKLHLPTGNHYLSYVDLHRSNAVWNVYAAPEFSLQPRSWWYPVVGRLTYRGYFSEGAAEAYGFKLKKKGFDVYVGGVDAYSTLGWFNDPVLNTFVDDSERRLAALIFHELSHQRLFISGDTEFNEAFATAVAEEGLRRWLMDKNDSSGLEKYQTDLKRKKWFVNLVAETRGKLNKIYDAPGSETASSRATKRAQKEIVLQQLRENYFAAKKEGKGNSGYDEWFDGPLNNAQLNTVSTYYDLVPAFHELIAQNGGDLDQFFTQVKKMAHWSKEKRHQFLESILPTGKKEFFSGIDSAKTAAAPPASAAVARP